MVCPANKSVAEALWLVSNAQYHMLVAAQTCGAAPQSLLVTTRHAPAKLSPVSLQAEGRSPHERRIQPHASQSAPLPVSTSFLSSSSSLHLPASFPILSLLTGLGFLVSLASVVSVVPIATLPSQFQDAVAVDRAEAPRTGRLAPPPGVRLAFRGKQRLCITNPSEIYRFDKASPLFFASSAYSA